MDNSGKEAEAMALLAEAERKVKNSQSFFSGLFGQQPADQMLTQFLLEPLLGTSNPWEPWRLAFLRQRLRPRSSGGSSKIEEACEIYARAANMFKMAKNWSAAGNAFCQAAQLHLQLQSKHDAATCFVDAGNAFKKADPQEAINCLMRAIEIYTDMGRFTIAAKHHISIAEIYETELVDIEKAIAHYEQSADYYKGEESNSSANKCLLKVAGYAAQLEQYQKAIDIYEQVGTNAMDSPLLKYSAKDYFFKAALCHFCIDMLNAKLAVQKYEELFPAFSDSRECKLMKKLLDAHEEQNVDSYTEAVKEYDAISRLDQWLTTMLLRIKKTIQGDEEDLR
ncbi:alpha-soluble NSF attachment protein isoform X2 [Sagmatias obliquidens]|uniref:alpha-soluble NSF attachment protein isoform X2 n=1 Tax=Sagmatias obliquidens TaxID=3371155 RepID=UPI000F445F68|nr:alpha-soluble NSF attachment protein isoform X2 [Lagenorhynchus obliquidens]XP_030729631.1 alpha-soluble NSF attachment protein isoform X2 [Globicephala melas]